MPTAEPKLASGTLGNPAGKEGERERRERESKMVVVCGDPDSLQENPEKSIRN